MIVFDGKAFAAQLLKRTADEVAVMTGPVKLATIYNSQNEAAKTYTRIKANTADSLGVLFEAYDLRDGRRARETIRNLNRDPQVRGVMIQLPFAGGWTDQGLCREIAPEKDVDGLNPKSGITPATVRAVAAIVQEGLVKTNKTGRWPLLMAIIGSRGNIGRAVVREYEDDIRFEIREMDLGEVRPDRVAEAEIIISAAGSPGVVTREMIKPGAVVVDVGFPEGDVTKEAAEVAGFVTPVPGGVGPVTVAMLFRNLMELG